MVTINRSGLDRKVQLMQERFSKLLSFLVRDAATFLQEKLKSEILNGETGENYPKSYPSGITQGEIGYVGVVSGQLRNAIDIDVSEIAKHEAFVFLNESLGAVGDYGRWIADWAARKYGQDYFQITLTLYGQFVNTKFIETIQEFFRQVNRGISPTYQNPF